MCVLLLFLLGWGEAMTNLSEFTHNNVNNGNALIVELRNIRMAVQEVNRLSAFTKCIFEESAKVTQYVIIGTDRRQYVKIHATCHIKIRPVC